MKIVAGIVTYNPSIERLERNIRAIVSQVNYTIIVDNASKNISDIKKFVKKFDDKKIKLICNNDNKGLANALNCIFHSIQTDTDWVLTLDQDSICPSNYIDKCRRYTNSNVGIINSPYLESNTGIVIGKRIELVSSVQRSITSGALVNREAYLKTTGYDEYLNIDYVDFDFSMKIIQAGYKILLMNDVLIEHELGNSNIKRFLFWKIRYTEHSGAREYLIARNIIVFIKRYYHYTSVIRDILSLIKHYFFIAIYASNKKEKLICLLQGTKAGMIIPLHQITSSANR